MTPYWKSQDGKIYNGNVLDVLKQLPDESVQMCVTSPPYWGLRDYGNDPIIWDEVGNNNSPNDGFCDHVWGSHKRRGYHTGQGFENLKEWNGQIRPPKEIPHTTKINSQFCHKCNAWKGSLGLEPTPELFIKHMVKIFAEVKRVLRKDGTCWVNMGDSYSGSMKGMNPDGTWSGEGKKSSEKQATNKGSVGLTVVDWKNVGLKPKDLCGIPWRLAFALQADGWWLRQDIIWHKPNPMPESVTDRCTKAHEYIFLLSKSAKYHYDADAIKEGTVTYDNGVRDRDNTKLNNTPGRTRMDGLVTNQYEKRNKRSVWTIPTQPMPEAHFATFPKKLIEPCILAGCPKNGMVLDPFLGSGTTALVSYRHDRKFIGIELSKTYLDEIAIPRIEAERKQRKLF